MTNPRKSKKKPVRLLLIGVFFSFGPMWGTLASVVGLAGAFHSDHSLQKEQEAAMATNIDVSLWTTVISWLMTPIGIVLILVSSMWLIRNWTLGHPDDSEVQDGK